MTQADLPPTAQVYPSSIDYRPFRIQSLLADHEILLKQCWATLLICWGYDVQMSDQDVQSRDAFVVLSIVGGERLEAKVKKRMFLRSKKPVEASKERRSQLSSNAFAEFQSGTVVLEHTRQTWRMHQGDDEDIGDIVSTASQDTVPGEPPNDDSDAETFYTARSSWSDSAESSVLDLPAKGSSALEYSLPLSVGSLASARRRFPFMKTNPELHQALCEVTRNDLLDNLILRFVRARKLEYSEVMKMLTRSLHWRLNECPVNEWVEEGDAPLVVKGKNAGFAKNFKVNKAFIRGQDKLGNPLFMFQLRKHFAQDATPAETERYALVIIEWCRLFLREKTASIDTCSLMFDLSGFSMKNADNGPVKFLIGLFEAHYPESLGIVIVHNAPWIFSTVWSVIKNWLDPVVASKIHFTKGIDDLRKFIADEYIPEYLGGGDKRPLEYKIPEESHCRPMRSKDQQYVELRRQRLELMQQLIENTIRWVRCTDPAASSEYLRERISLNYALSDNYVQLDPYLRNPGVYDRDGSLKVGN